MGQTSMCLFHTGMGGFLVFVWSGLVWSGRVRSAKVQNCQFLKFPERETVVYFWTFNNLIEHLIRRYDTGFGIWDLARKLATMAKFGPFGQNRDFFGTILGPFWDFFFAIFMKTTVKLAQD